MGIYDGTVEVTRRTMVLFFVVDVSGSMSGTKIGTVNSAIEEIVPELKDISENNPDAQIKVATLTFSTGAKWIDSEPVPAERYQWNYLDAFGLTDLGEACMQLDEKLSRRAFMSDTMGSFAPAIFLLSDGEPTDNYQHGLEKLKQNSWFKKAIKVAIAIGEDANRNILAEFTGSREAVVEVRTTEALKRWIQFVSVRASEIGSKSTNVNPTGGDVYRAQPNPQQPVQPQQQYAQPQNVQPMENAASQGVNAVNSGYVSKQQQMIQDIQAQAADSVDWDDFDSEDIQW